MTLIGKSKKLKGICYDIRGPVLDQAVKLEESGQQILKLNIGNPAPFGFDAPDELITDIIHNIRNGQGYTVSKGLFSARNAIMQECQRLDITDVAVDNVFLGNGASELIVMATQALLNDGDEVLVPSPDYPLWTAAVNLSGGKAVHYLCDELSDWQPDINDVATKVNSRTRALVIINPNNPTGAVYSRELLEQLIQVACNHNLVIFADEIYSKIIYEDAEFIPVARLAKDALCVTFNGLSKSYRAAGFRCGWMILSGAISKAQGYISGLDMLASMRLCANVPAMYAVQTALGGYQSINDLVLPGGRLREQRDLAWRAITNIPGISCVKPKGAIYLFPRIDCEMYRIDDDEQLILDFLRREKILLVQGTAFNWKSPDHFRIVFLPQVSELALAIDRFRFFLERYRR